MRKQNLLKITIENQNILKRLQDKPSFYKVSDWEESFKKREHILKTMCEYPYILEQKKNSTFYGENPGMNGSNSQNNSVLDPFATVAG